MLMPMLWNNERNYIDPIREMNRMMDSFWGTGLPAAASMRTDVTEQDGEYCLDAELPGFNKEDIRVELNDHILTISASHQDRNDEKNEEGRYIRRERRSSSYSRSFSVAENITPEDITAKYENGVLTVHIPKKEEIPAAEEAKRIEIQ